MSANATVARAPASATSSVPPFSTSTSPATSQQTRASSRAPDLLYRNPAVSLQRRVLLSSPSHHRVRGQTSQNAVNMAQPSYPGYPPYNGQAPPAYAAHPQAAPGYEAYAQPQAAPGYGSYAQPQAAQGYGASAGYPPHMQQQPYGNGQQAYGAPPHGSVAVPMQQGVDWSKPVQPVAAVPATYTERMEKVCFACPTT